MAAKKTPEQVAAFIQEIRQRNIELVDGYQCMEYQNTFRCLIESCHHKWVNTFANVSKGSGCRRCKDEALMSSGKYRLGALCQKGHEHKNSGQSLRVKSNEGCYECAKNQSYKRNKINTAKRLAAQKQIFDDYVLEAEKTFEYNKSTHVLGKPCNKEGHTIPGFNVSLRYIKHGTIKNICVMCSVAADKKHRTTHRDKILPKRRELYKKPEHLAVRQAYLSVYRERACVISATRRSRKLDACPKWLDESKLEPFYAHAALMTRVTGIVHNVDHIEPLISDLVCGLHVPANLRITTQFVNYSKNNRFTPFVLSNCNEL